MSFGNDNVTTAKVYELCERLNQGARCTCRGTEHICKTIEKLLAEANGDLELAAYIQLEDQLFKQEELNRREELDT